MSRPLDELAAQVRELSCAITAMAADVAAVRLLLEGKPRRDALICELADRLALGGATWAAATSVHLILAGIRAAPPEASIAATALAGTRLSARQILRILQAQAAEQAADKTRALCQWPSIRQSGGIVNDEPDHER